MADDDVHQGSREQEAGAAPSKLGARGNATQGTSEREERITGYVGVKNKKGEVVNPGSTTSPKGGAGLGDDAA